jgi:hypothetical protein
MLVILVMPGFVVNFIVNRFVCLLQYYVSTVYSCCRKMCALTLAVLRLDSSCNVWVRY